MTKTHLLIIGRVSLVMAVRKGLRIRVKKIEDFNQIGNCKGEVLLVKPFALLNCGGEGAVQRKFLMRVREKVVRDVGAGTEEHVFNMGK